MEQRGARRWRRTPGKPLADPQETVRTVSQRLRFTDAQQAGILAFTERPRRVRYVSDPVFA